jgi:ubiquinol-cytochrome c reductase cytochrome c subunit
MTTPSAPDEHHKSASTARPELVYLSDNRISAVGEGTLVNEELDADLDAGDELDAELGFEPAVSATGADLKPARAGRTSRDTVTAKARRRRGGLARRLSAAGVLLAALASMGGAYAAFATTSGAADDVNVQQQVAEGQQLFENSCITCHGSNLQGVENRGPSLIGVGSAAVYFQVSTGRMPLAQQGAEADRKTPKFNDAQTRALAAYIQSVGGGPMTPSGKLRGDSAVIADGGELFRLNCAQCHGATGRGAALSAGKKAPNLGQATDLQIYTAMQSGPESMPVFGDNEITPDQKKAIIAYIQTLKASNDPGGAGIGRIGPVSEAIVIWVGGVGLLMLAILWIGAKQQ